MAVVLGTTVFANQSSGNTTLSWTHDHSSGTDNGIIAVAVNVSQNISSAGVNVTVAGSSMTRVETVLQNANRFEWWWIGDPTTGNNTIEITLSTAANRLFRGFSLSFTGVDSTAAIKNSTFFGGASTVWTANLDTDSSGMMVMGGNWDDSNINFTAGSGSTLLHNSSVGSKGRSWITVKTPVGTTGSISANSDVAADRPVGAISLTENVPAPPTGGSTMFKAFVLGYDKAYKGMPGMQLQNGVVQPTHQGV